MKRREETSSFFSSPAFRKQNSGYNYTCLPFPTLFLWENRYWVLNNWFTNKCLDSISLINYGLPGLCFSITQFVCIFFLVISCAYMSNSVIYIVSYLRAGQISFCITHTVSNTVFWIQKTFMQSLYISQSVLYTKHCGKSWVKEHTVYAF